QDEPPVLFDEGNLRCLDRFELLQRLLQHGADALGPEIVDIADQVAGRVDDVQSLQSAALADELAGEFSLGVLAPAGAVVGDADAHEVLAEQLYHLRIVESRRTEGHNVVSATPERLAAGHPYEERLLLPRGLLPAFQDRDLPRDRAPQLVLR